MEIGYCGWVPRRLKVRSMMNLPGPSPCLVGLDHAVAVGVKPFEHLVGAGDALGDSSGDMGRLSSRPPPCPPRRPPPPRQSWPNATWTHIARTITSSSLPRARMGWQAYPRGRGGGDQGTQLLSILTRTGRSSQPYCPGGKDGQQCRNASEIAGKMPVQRPKTLWRAWTARAAWSNVEGSTWAPPTY